MINLQAFPWFQLKLIVEVLIAPLVILMPRNRRKILFGAWKGKQFSCNPRCLCEYVAKSGGFECIWIGNQELEERVREVPGVKFVRKGSLAAFWHAITAWTYVFNINFEDDIIRLPRYGRVNLLYVTHGYVDKQNYSKRDVVRVKKRFQWLRDAQWCLWKRLYRKDAWCSDCSELAVQTLLEHQLAELHPERMMRYGSPRSDFFFINGQSSEVKEKYRRKYAEILGLPLDKKWYVFVPTWRHDATNLVSFTKMGDQRELNRILDEQNAIIIEKQHPIVLETMDFAACSTDNVHVVNKEEARLLVLQDLLVACDRMITDVSSVFFDFYLMNRPVIHYVYDYDHFMNDEFGFVYDVKKYCAGPLAYNEKELLRCLDMSDDELLERRNPETGNYLLTYVHGEACEHYYELLKRLASSKRFFVPERPDEI